MEPAAYLDALRSDGSALNRAARGALDVGVPSCPGWSMADLVAHVGQVHRDKAGIVRAGASSERPPRAQDPTVTGDALLDWYDEGLADLLEVLAAADPDQPTWSWSRHAGDARVGFWQRRLAHETAVHRWDAEHAAGLRAAAIGPAALAADGVDEVLDVWLGDPDDPPYAGPAGTLHLHASDTPGEWLLRLGADGAAGRVEVLRGHQHADAALLGPASDLDLVLWGRLPASGLGPLGDVTLLDGFLAWLSGE